MRSILEAGLRNDVGDNLFLTSAAAYKNILQMKEVPLKEGSGQKNGFPVETGSQMGLLSKK
ncbi:MULTISPECIES: hypothetical protein [unclassified Polaromonas]|uniref:hypothetical protein n=1 Tax=unclassified Polaromonas TaxID=2638319 RepID=UPI00129E8255|nr:MULTISPECIES: hypothetical protein [unclassified Polaromonas]QGJ20330.1 hypothetical protein F7R28_19310 [Polaromonas sp. Pch-P]